MISCIISTYNRPISILKRALDSILSQTIKDIEVIIVNDAPENIKLSNEIRDFLNDYKDIKLKYIEHERNMGACAARNTGIKNAEGEFLAFLDDDDEWMENKLEVMVKYFNDPSIGLVYCNHKRINEINGENRIIKPEIHEEDAFRTLLVKNFIGSTSFPLLRSSVVKNVGMFDEKLKSSQDVDLWIRIAEHSNIKYVDECLNIYYVSEKSITSNMKNKIEGYEYQLKKYANIYQEDKQLLNHKLNVIAWTFLFCKNIRKFLHYYIFAIKIAPFSKYNLLVFNKIINKVKRVIN